jgi:hypothetical protein
MSIGLHGVTHMYSSGTVSTDGKGGFTDNIFAQKAKIEAEVDQVYAPLPQKI